MMTRPLRILMILHMPWTRDLGAPRVQFEIAEEFIKLGHQVDKFDCNDAIPHPNRLSSVFFGTLFSKRAAQFVQQYGHNYDVIDAHQANLPYTKQELKFDGLLCARSCGLGHFYLQYEQAQELKRKREGRRKQGTRLGNALRWAAKRLGPTIADYDRSFACADLINVLNSDEYQFVTQTLGWADKTVFFPHGLTDERFAEFAAAAVKPDIRLAHQQVVFIGYWGERKGAKDFPAIVQAIRQELPATKFLFLGVGQPSEVILSQFEESDRPYISAIPSFDPKDLPGLLSGSTVGIFPSYCEGFPWSVLEKLAAGLPVIAYDIPGSRETLKLFSESMLVGPGNALELAQKVVQILRSPLSKYAELSSQALHISAQYRGHDIAVQLLGVYQEKLKQIGKL